MTRSAWAFILGAALLIVVGWSFTYVEVLVLGLGALVCFLAAWVWVGFPPNVRVEQSVEPSRVERGDPAVGLVEVQNSGNRRTPALVAEEPYGTTAETVFVPPLAPGELRSFALPLSTDRRGFKEVGPLVVIRGDPFGLIRFRRQYGPARTLWVYPKTHRITAIPAGLARDIEGPTVDTSPDGTITFHALREYVRGDDLRRVHWRSSARTGTLMVRQYIDTSQPDTVVALDTRLGAHTTESFESAVEAAASLVRACSEKNFPMRLQSTSGLSLDASRLSSPYQHLLERLALVELSAQGTTQSLVEHLRAWAGASLLAVMAGTVGPVDLDALTSLRRSFKRVVIVSFAKASEMQGHTSPAGMSFVNALSADEFAARWNGLRR